MGPDFDLSSYITSPPEIACTRSRYELEHWSASEHPIMPAIIVADSHRQAFSRYAPATIIVHTVVHYYQKCRDLFEKRAVQSPWRDRGRKKRCIFSTKRNKIFPLSILSLSLATNPHLFICTLWQQDPCGMNGISCAPRVFSMGLTGRSVLAPLMALTCTPPAKKKQDKIKQMVSFRCGCHAGRSNGFRWR